MRDITLDIVGASFCPFFLYPAVFPRGLGMSPQIIPEGKVSSQLRRILRTYVQMVLLQVLFALVFERLSSGDAKVAFVMIADLAQGGYDVFPYGAIFNDNVNINDRFCR